MWAFFSGSYQEIGHWLSRWYPGHLGAILGQYQVPATSQQGLLLQKSRHEDHPDLQVRSTDYWCKLSQKAKSMSIDSVNKGHFDARDAPSFGVLSEPFYTFPVCCLYVSIAFVNIWYICYAYAHDVCLVSCSVVSLQCILSSVATYIQCLAY